MVYRSISLTESDMVVLHPSLLPELRKLGDDVLGIYEVTEQVRISFYFILFQI